MPFSFALHVCETGPLVLWGEGLCMRCIESTSLFYLVVFVYFATVTQCLNAGDRRVLKFSAVITLNTQKKAMFLSPWHVHKTLISKQVLYFFCNVLISEFTKNKFLNSLPPPTQNLNSLKRATTLLSGLEHVWPLQHHCSVQRS